jgi:hypothetical protein
MEGPAGAFVVAPGAAEGAAPAEAKGTAEPAPKLFCGQLSRDMPYEEVGHHVCRLLSLQLVTPLSA